MTVLQAIRKAARLKRLGWTIMLIISVQLAMFAVLLIYDFGTQLKASFLWKIGDLLQNACNLVYQKTIFLKPLWSVTPRYDIANPFNVDFLLFIGMIAILGMGAYIRDSGKQLAKEVATVKKRARDEIWLRSMLPQDQKGTVINQPASVMVLNLPMPPSEAKNWWERPVGLLLMGLAITYIGALLTKISGLT